MTMSIRPVRPDDAAECVTIVDRMEQTLIEVLGSVEAARAVHSRAEIVERLAWHLDRIAAGTAQVFVAESTCRGSLEGSAVEGSVVEGSVVEAAVVGHTIVRLDPDDATRGVFATTYVAPEARRLGAAAALLQHGEAWFVGRGARLAITYTDPGNDKLQQLYVTHGYTLRAAESSEFIALEKALPAPT